MTRSLETKDRNSLAQEVIALINRFSEEELQDLIKLLEINNKLSNKELKAFISKAILPDIKKSEIKKLCKLYNALEFPEMDVVSTLPAIAKVNIGIECKYTSYGTVEISSYVDDWSYDHDSLDSQSEIRSLPEVEKEIKKLEQAQIAYETEVERIAEKYKTTPENIHELVENEV